MDFRLKIEGESNYLSRAFIENFYYQIDIYNLYSYATLVLKDISKTLFNIIKTGMDIDVEFYDQVNDSTSYLNKMRVLSFEKTLANSETIVDKIKIKLISAWYFDYKINSGAFSGSLGEIAQSIVSPYNNIYFNCDISSTDDAPRIRYKTEETDQQFLSRIQKYGYKENLPVYIYHNAKGNLLLRGISDFIKDDSKFVGTADTSKYLGNIPNLNEYTNIRFTSYKFTSDTLNSHSQTSTKFTLSNFKLPEGSNIPPGITLSNSENNNIQSSRTTPSIRIFSGWNLTPDDALALTAKDNFERNIKAYYLVGIVPGFLMNIDLGQKISMYLPYNPVLDPKTGKNKNLGEGDYIVKHIDYIFKNNIMRTKLYLVQVAY